MKTKIALIILLINLIGYSQNGINYKAVIKDDNGNVVATDLVQVQFNILKGNAQTNVYSETHTPTTDENGIIVLKIGEGTLVANSETFDTIEWAEDSHFLQVLVNIGNGLTNMGISEFKTVPYALSSENHPWSKDENGIHALDHNIGVNIEQPEYSLDLRSSNTVDPSQLNISNQDKSRYIRFYSGSEAFPDPSTTWAPGHSLLFATFDDNTLDFQEYMRISPSGNVGLGITDPQARLDVNGKIKISDDNTNPTEGSMRYNSVTKNFEGYNGNEWLILNNPTTPTITTVTAPDNSSTNFSEFTLLGDDRISFSIDFSTAMNESSAVIGSSVLISGNGGNATGTITWSNGGTRLTITTDQTYFDLSPDCFSGFQVILKGEGSNQLLNSDDYAIDGDDNGSIGGDFIVQFALIC
nr:hypothetical protein [uncultured Psychroserpens sp.]